jgi:hypothetical protein
MVRIPIDQDARTHAWTDGVAGPPGE